MILTIKGQFPKHITFDLAKQNLMIKLGNLFFSKNVVYFLP